MTKFYIINWKDAVQIIEIECLRCLTCVQPIITLQRSYVSVWKHVLLHAHIWIVIFFCLWNPKAKDWINGPQVVYCIISVTYLMFNRRVSVILKDHTWTSKARWFIHTCSWFRSRKTQDQTAACSVKTYLTCYLCRPCLAFSTETCEAVYGNRVSDWSSVTMVWLDEISYLHGVCDTSLAAALWGHGLFPSVHVHTKWLLLIKTKNC